MKVFLGGTCNDSTWREQLIPNLTIDYFNPVVPDWTEECYQRELEERKNCDIVLYVITPKMTGVYSIAEVTDDSNKRPEKTVLSIIPVDGDNTFTPGQLKSLGKVGEMVITNGGAVIPFDHLAEFLNDYRAARDNIKEWYNTHVLNK